MLTISFWYTVVEIIVHFYTDGNVKRKAKRGEKEIPGANG